MSKITAEQAAADFRVWAEYIDPCGIYSEDEFLDMSIGEREKMAQEVIDSNAG